MSAPSSDPSPHRAAAAVDPAAGATRGAVSILLRLEGALVVTAAMIAYRAYGGGWLLFALTILLPDLGMLGYLAGRKFGAALYNTCHTYLAPAALAAIGWSQHLPVLFAPALIWAAHIGFDRLMGYGFKYGTAFGATHLGWRGKREGPAPRR